MVARTSPSFEVLELDWTEAGTFLAEGRAEARAAEARR
jgi:hypothetical protein